MARAIFRPTERFPTGWVKARLTGFSDRPPAKDPDGHEFGGPRILYEFTAEGGPADGSKVYCLDSATFDVGSWAYRILRAVGVNMSNGAFEIDTEWVTRNLFGRPAVIQAETLLRRGEARHWLTAIRPVRRPAAPERRSAAPEPAARPAPEGTRPAPVGKTASDGQVDHRRPSDAPPPAWPAGKPLPF